MSWARANPAEQRLVALMQDDSHKGLPGRIAIRQPFSVAPARLTCGRVVLHFGIPSKAGCMSLSCLPAWNSAALVSAH